MKLLDFAIQMEQDAQQMYTQAAEVAAEPAMERMCRMLMEDEKRHERMLRDLQAEETPEYIEGDWEGMRNVYSEMIRSGGRLIEGSEGLAALLEKARGMEHKGADMYQEMADATADPAKKRLILRLRGEELKHEKIVEMAHEYVANPATVLEDQEFNWYGHEGTP